MNMSIIIKVDFFRFKNFYVVRCYGGVPKGDYLVPSLTAAKDLVNKWNKNRYFQNLC